MPDWSKVGKRSRNKGASYERKIGHTLSLWWTKGKDKRAFRRTVMSGGWDKRFAAGDLLAPVPDFPLHIEIRKREEFSMCAMLKGGAPLQWWLDGMDEKYPEKRLWYVMSKNGEKDYLVMDWLSWMTIRKKLGSKCVELDLSHFIFTIRISSRHVRMAIMLLKDFLEFFTVDDFIEAFNVQEGSTQ